MEITLIYLSKRIRGVIFLYYIQETDKPNVWSKQFNIIKQKEDKIILPIGGEKISQKKAEKLAQKTKKMLQKSTCHKVILSKKMKNQEDYKNYLYTYGLDIVEGKWLWEVLSAQVLEYVVKKKKMKKQEIQISILVNEMSENLLANIKQIVREYKRVNIVTNHIKRFQKIEEQILEKEGIMITVGNNKRKSLSKSNIILNVDYPTELINQYNIYEEAVIIHLRKNVKINQKRFNGMSIHDYEISFTSFEEFDFDKNNLYHQKDIYESQIYQKQPFESIQRKIKTDKVRIKYLKGNQLEW